MPVILDDACASALCRDQPIFLQDWFTEIAGSRSKLQVTTVVEDGNTVACLRLARHTTALGLKQAYNLPWARLGGIHHARDNGGTRGAVAGRLVEQLPTNISYYLTLSDEADYQAFLDAGFHHVKEDNYLIPCGNLDATFQAFSKMTKRHLRKAEDELEISTADADWFIEWYESHLALRKRGAYAELETARDILAEAIRRNQASILTVWQPDHSEPDAAVACLWDDRYCYYWMTTRRVATGAQRRPHQGAVKLLVWRAIQIAHNKGLTFHLDGVQLDLNAPKDGPGRFYEGFGAQRTPRFTVVRETTFARALAPFRGPIKRALRRTLGRFVALKWNH